MLFWGLYINGKITVLFIVHTLHVVFSTLLKYKCVKKLNVSLQTKLSYLKNNDLCTNVSKKIQKV